MKLLPQGQYNFKDVEEKILKFWLSKPYYKPEYDPKTDTLLSLQDFKVDDKEKWVLVCPPPNAYDRPHMGNLSGYPYMDAMGRYNRIKGRRVLLFPGKDHAGIEGEVSFIRYNLEPNGKKKEDFTREEFYNAIYNSQQHYIQLIKEDEQRLGLSADYERDLYTLDSKSVNVVLNTFVEMFEKGLVYKGVRIVNWDPKSKSALSDSQCERKEAVGNLYTVKYPIVLNKFWFIDKSSVFMNPDDICYLPLFYNSGEGDSYQEMTKTDIVCLKDNEGLLSYFKIDYVKIYNWNEADINELPLKIDDLYQQFKNLYPDYLIKEPKGFVKIKLQNLDDSDYLYIATTRPETMLGDTALVVNPDDNRYKHLIGKKALVPIVNRVVQIITNPRVQVDFGTGVLKLTPAHSLEDYEIMLEWNNWVDLMNRENPSTHEFKFNKVDYLNVINKEAKLCGPIPEKYKGLKTSVARDVIVQDLKNLNLLAEVKQINQNLLISERSGAVIEPLISSQWFIDVSSLKEKLIDVISNGELKIYPKYAERRYLSWVNNLRDWAISRSLWWGYRLPVWYHGEIKEEIDENGKVKILINLENKGNWIEMDFNNANHMRVQIQSPGDDWFQDEDILDTWFSSGQWPIVCLTVSDLMDCCYPTDVLVSGYDLLIKWDLFMILFGVFKTGKVPFKNLYLTGLVKGTDGQKMSKSRKNFIPIDGVKEQFGVDAFRLNCFYQNRAGKDYSITPQTLKNFRNFNNKIWNASKFVISNLIDLDINNYKFEANYQLLEFLKENNWNDNDDLLMLNEIIKLEKEWDYCFHNFKFGRITERLYSSFWHYFCDKYIEAVKTRLKNSNDDKSKLYASLVLYYSLKSYLKLLHPFIPFITEEIWQHLINDAKYEMPMMYQFNW